MSKLIATSQITLINLAEKAIDRTEVTFWHGLSATKRPAGIYDCPNRDHSFANEFDVVSGKKYTIRVIAQRTKGSIGLKGGIWYTQRTSGNAFDGLAALTQIGELSEDGLGIWERTFTASDGKTKGKTYIQIEQPFSGGSTAYRVYDAQIFDGDGNQLVTTEVTDQPATGALTSPMAAPDGTYIWKRTITYYTDGTNDIVWEYSGVGSRGANGTNGQTSHVHFAFADNATGGGFSLTTPKAYMGWYADFNETASNDPTKYKWGKWKGDQGVRGDKGDDGKTSYLHLAFASSADGRTGFSFTESSQQYQGYYTDFTQTSSTDPTKYIWMDRRAGVEVGGVNLLHNSKGPFQPKGSKIDNYVTYSNTWINMEKGKEYTLSAKGTAPFTGSHTTDKEKNEICLWLVKHDENINVDRIISSSSTGNGGTKFTWSDPSGKYYLRVNTYKIDNSNYAEDVQIEEGNVKTTYTRNPEDVQADIDSKADQALTQEQLNALAEKNRNMEAELAAKASLETIEQWKQAYDAYVAQNDADKTSAEQKLITLTSRVAEWVKDWEDKKVQWSFLDTNMDFGAEGLRLGKKGSPTSILISNDRIGFYSGGSEVASMSNGTLTIDNGIFAKSLQIGHYREEVYEGDKTINVIRWID